MVLKLAVLSTLILLLLGCSKNKTEDALPAQPEVSCKVMSEYLNEALYRAYAYNADSLLYRITQYEASPVHRIQKRYTFDYNQKQQVSEFRETSLLSPFTNYRYTLHYTPSGSVDTIRKYRVINTGSELSETYGLEYDTQNRLNKYTWDEGRSFWRYEYDEAGNVRKWFAKIEGVYAQEVLLAEYNNYDAMRNAYADVSPVRWVNLVEGGGVSPHNPGSFKLYEVSDEPVQTGVITYLYNQNRQPTEASVSSFSSGGASTTRVYKFAYECL